MPERHTRPDRTLRPSPHSGPAVPGRAAFGDIRGLQDVRRRPAASRSDGDCRPLHLLAPLGTVQPAGIRRAVLPAAPAGWGELPERHLLEHGRAHSRALGRPDPPTRHGGRALAPFRGETGGGGGPAPCPPPETHTPP